MSFCRGKMIKTKPISATSHRPPGNKCVGQQKGACHREPGATAGGRLSDEKRTAGAWRLAFAVRTKFAGQRPPAEAERRSGPHGACAVGGGALQAVREASQIRRARLKASERVSLMSMALAVFSRPNQGERLRPRRCWEALRDSA